MLYSANKERPAYIASGCVVIPVLLPAHEAAATQCVVVQFKASVIL